MLTEKEITIVKYLQNPSSMSTEKSLKLQEDMDVDGILQSLYQKSYIEPISKPEAETGDILKYTSLTEKGEVI